MTSPFFHYLATFGATPTRNFASFPRKNGVLVVAFWVDVWQILATLATVTVRIVGESYGVMS
jgi:hypothetical protein